MTERVHERLPRRSSADTDGEARRVLGKLEEVGRDVLMFRILANAPTGFVATVRMADALMYRSTVPAALRETVILWCARRQNAGYEWVEHEPLALDAAVTRSQLDAIARQDRTSSEFSGSTILALRAADELLDGRALDPQLWRELIEAFDDRGALELVLCVAWWGAWAPTVMRALGLDESDVERPSDSAVAPVAADEESQ